MQDTFARVLSKPRMLRGDDELAYLMRVLRNTYFTSRRTASRRPVSAAPIEDALSADGNPTSRPEYALQVRELYAAIASLPEDFRLALVSIDILGLSYREAARSLKTREATITTRLYRARKQVVKIMEEDVPPPVEPPRAQRARDDEAATARRETGPREEAPPNRRLAEQGNL